MDSLKNLDKRSILVISFKVFAVSLISTSIYMLYFFFIGVPKTQSRNFYNSATRAEQDGNLDLAIEHIKEAQKHWNDEYLELELQRLIGQK